MRTPQVIATLLASGAFAIAATPLPRRVTVSVSRVMQIDNLDGDFVRADRADFYAQIWIGGKLHRTKTFISDDGNPAWRYGRRVSGDKIHMRLKLIDDDGGLEDRDDYVDINPRDGKKDLNFTLEVSTGRITGDVTGRRGQTIHSTGGKDGDKAEIWFVVR